MERYRTQLQRPGSDTILVSSANKKKKKKREPAPNSADRRIKPLPSNP